jgi:exoribonuclease R
MIGRLALSSRNVYKIPKNGKMVSARKCYILSENTDDMLVQTNKDFNPQDIYVLINTSSNTVDEVLGTVGNPEDDLNIYHHLYTLSWLSNKKYLDLWKNYDFNPEFDLAKLNNINREIYTDQVITIDPLGSIDLDDGYSFKFDSEYYYLDIHIADPVSYFDFTKEPMIKIFDEFVNRINTCYIPDSKGSNHAIHLLPDFIVKYVSLLGLNEEINYRRAVSFCFKINKSNGDINFHLKHTNLNNVVNKTYEQFDMEINRNSEQKNILVNLSNLIIGKENLRLKELVFDSDISHQMIEVFMILVNLYAGKYLQLIRSKMLTRIQDGSELPENFEQIPDYCRNFLNHSANYKISEPDENNLHFSLGISNYTHASSPMRRVIDMINHLQIYQLNSGILQNLDIEKINSKMKIQKRISNTYDLICYLKKSYRFKAFLMDLKVLEDKSFGLLVVSSGTEFKKMINVELPKNITGLEKFKEIDVEIYYNAVKFKTSKFPVDIKIIQ